MVLTPNQDLNTKLDGNPHKLIIKYRISMFKAQVDSDVGTLDFLNLEIMLNLDQIVHLFQFFLSLGIILDLIV
jgi:hypothetical protein